MFSLMSSLLLLLRLVTIRSHRPVIRTFTSSNTRNAPHATSTNPFTYSIRPASPDDIYKINQCNLDNLKENYSHQFYTNHLQRFPDLSFIAETDRFEMVKTLCYSSFLSILILEIGGICLRENGSSSLCFRG